MGGGAACGLVGGSFGSVWGRLTGEAAWPASEQMCAVLPPRAALPSPLLHCASLARVGHGDLLLRRAPQTGQGTRGTPQVPCRGCVW